MEVANKELFTYHEGNMGVTVKQLFPRVNSYNIEVVFKYVRYEKKFVKKHACMVSNAALLSNPDLRDTIKYDYNTILVSMKEEE